MNHKVWFGWDLGEWPHSDTGYRGENGEISVAGPSGRAGEKVG